MKLGVSIYTGEDYSHNDNMKYIEMCGNLGISGMFTSFNISEDNTGMKETMELIEQAKSSGLHTSVDVSSRIFKIFNVKLGDLSKFRDIGIDDIRLDYGFDAKDVATMSKNDVGIGLVLNASTTYREYLEKFFENGGKKENIKGCHNFYPRPYTGLSYDFYADKTAILREFGIGVSAFIPSDTGKRGPIYEGLPTIEAHRNIPSYIAAKEFAYKGDVDTLYMGDAYAKKDELDDILTIDPNVIELPAELFDGLSSKEKGILFKGCHTNRKDASGYIVRSTESRMNNIGRIEPFNCIDRRFGSITIDNENMGRYMGELQLVRDNLPSDPRVNVVGRIAKDHMMFLEYIRPGAKFKLVERGGLL